MPTADTAAFAALAPSAVTFAVLAPTLVAGHWLADHIAQTDHQAAHKAARTAAGWRAMAGHILSYHLVLAAFAASTILALHLHVTGPGLITGLAISAITHTILDRRWPVRRILIWTRSPAFAQTTTPVNGMYLADQSLHHTCLWAAALAVACL